MVRCHSDVDYDNWRKSFETQIKCSPESIYIRPTLMPTISSLVPRIVIIDLGSTSVRAGIVGITRKYGTLFYT